MKNAALSIMIALAFSGCVSLERLLEPGESPYAAEARDGRTEFGKGFAVFRDGLPTAVRLEGSHYEMGRQFGVLLGKRLRGLLEFGRNQIVGMADSTGLAPDLLASILLRRTRAFYDNLPVRYQEELRGIAEGSGIRLATLIMFRFFEAAVQAEENSSGSCSGIVIRDAEGRLYHSWNRDGDFGWMFAENAVVIDYHPTGYLASFETKVAVTTGTEDGRNAAGLTVSTNSRSTGTVRGAGDYHTVLRMIMEECRSFEDVERLLDRVDSYDAFSIFVSDEKTGQARIYECLAGKDLVWRSTPMTGSIQWDLNHYVDPGLAAEHEDRFRADSAYENVREAQMREFFADRAARDYSLDDLVRINRANSFSGSADPERTLLGESIANAWTTKSVIYGPEGIYVAASPGYLASLADIYLFPFDLAADPVLAFPAEAVPGRARSFGEIIAAGDRREGALQAMKALSDRFPDSAFFAYQAAMKAWETQSDFGAWAEYARRAYSLLPEDPEYAVEGAAASFALGEFDEARAILEGLDQQGPCGMKALFIRLILLSGIAEAGGRQAESVEYLSQARALPVFPKYKAQIDDYLKQLRGIFHDR